LLNDDTLNNENLMQQTYLSIGFPLGILLNENGSDALTGKEPAYWVRRGGSFVTLYGAESQAWTLCLSPTRGTDIEEFLLKQGIVNSPEDCEGTVLYLLREELLTPFDEKSVGSILDLLVFSQGTGFGSTSKDPLHYEIGGTDGKPMACLDLRSYILWTHCDGRTLREAIQATIECLQTDEHVLMNNLFTWLRSFIIARVVYFDTQPE